MASSSYCKKLVEKYTDELETLKKKMNKNLTDMDLKNASVQTDMEKAVKEMTALCDTLKRKINNYTFE